MTTRYEAQNITQLVELVAQGNPDMYDTGPVVAEIALWDGRTVTACYFNAGTMQPRIFDLHDMLTDIPTVERLVKQMLAGGFTGSSFIAETGESDMVCRLIWEITEKKSN